MQRFTKLQVWRRNHALVLAIYRATASFPLDERFGITAQVRRAAVSVATNIAEGSKRATPLDYARFLNMAEGSLAEVECLVMLSQDLGFLGETKTLAILKEADEIARMLNALRLRVEQGAGRKVRNSRP